MVTVSYPVPYAYHAYYVQWDVTSRTINVDIICKKSNYKNRC